MSRRPGDALRNARRLTALVAASSTLFAGCVSSGPTRRGLSGDISISSTPSYLSQEPPYEPKVQRNSDGTVTRFLYVRPDRGATLFELIKDHAKLPFGTITVKTGTEKYNYLPSDAKSPIAIFIYDLMIVTGTEEQCKAIEDFIDLMEAQTPLVEIEAKIVEINSTDDFQLGAVTRFKDNKNNGDGNPQTIFDSAIGQFDTVNSLAARATNADFEGFLLNLGTIQSGIKVDILVQALVQMGYAEILSAPRITVMNGYPASIVTGQEVPVSSVKQIGATTFVDVTFKQAGIQLRVVPFITGKNAIQLEIEPEVSAVVGFTSAGTRGLQNPILNTRSASTVVTDGNGETYVIGGLITNSQIEDELKTPLLGDIPVLGWLFRSTRKRNAATQLIFFITPRIVPPPGHGTKRLLIPPDENGD